MGEQCQKTKLAPTLTKYVMWITVHNFAFLIPKNVNHKYVISHVSPCSSPHTEAFRHGRRTACSVGGAGRSHSRNNGSGRVYPSLLLLAEI